MTIFRRLPTISPSSMTSTIRLVKYFLAAAAYIALCSVLVVVRKYSFVIQNANLSVNSSDGLLFSYIRNNSENTVAFSFEEEAVVRFEDLDLGTAVNEKEVERDLRRIGRTCERYNKTEEFTRNHFLYSPKNRALYCWIRKVGSTSFTKFFGDLRGRRVARNYYREINFLAPETVEQLGRIIDDESVFKFVVVRHPFERLVSSYRDRIEDNSRYTAQAWMYAPRIFHLTRPELFRSNETGGNGLQRIFNAHRRLKLIPTFAEFVEWLLKERPENDDVHWYRYNEHCSLCAAKFDYVLKLDNYTLSDVDYIFSKLGLDANRTYLPKLQRSRGGSTDFARTCEYFASLPRDSVLRLYERYRIDFEMFDYGHEDYLNCAVTQETGS